MVRALDITGERYGKLTALRLTRHPTQRGRWWVCRCDCGREDVALQWRLRLPPGDSHAVHGCEVCRAKHCVVCGAAYLGGGSGVTCGAQSCRVSYRRAAHAALEARYAEAGGTRTQRLAARSQEAYEANLVKERERSRRKRARLTPEQKDAQNAHLRAAYAASPEAQRKMAEKARRHRRKQALADMARDAGQLMEKFNDRNN